MSNIADTEVQMSGLRNRNYDPNDPSTNVQDTPEVRIADPSSRSVNRATDLDIEQASTSNQARRDEADPDEFDEDDEELILKYDAQHVIKIFKPVTVCLIFVIVFLSLITSYQKSDGQQLYELKIICF
jgi:hypothetical protein